MTKVPYTLDEAMTQADKAFELVDWFEQAGAADRTELLELRAELLKRRDREQAARTDDVTHEQDGNRPITRALD